MPATACALRLLLLAAAAGCGGSAPSEDGAVGSDVPLASRAGQSPTWLEVAPVLTQYCVVCHSGEAAPFGLRLDSYEAVLAGSERGEVVRRGAPEESELIRRLRGTSQPRMPLVGPPVPDSLIARIAEWIAAGAPLGDAEPPAIAARRPLPAPGASVTFADVQPILLQRCVKCHGDASIMGAPPEGLRLETLEQVRRGGERVVVVPGAPLASELWRRVAGLARPRMPLDGPPYLSDEELRVMRDWIAQGARAEDGEPATPVAGGRIRLHGTLDTPATLDGLRLILPPGARIEARAGDYVEVRGTLDEAGRVRVERMRRD